MLDISYPVTIWYSEKIPHLCRISYWSGSETYVSSPRQQELHWLPFPEGITFRLAVVVYLPVTARIDWRRRWSHSIFMTSEFRPAQLNAGHLANNKRTKHYLLDSQSSSLLFTWHPPSGHMYKLILHSLCRNAAYASLMVLDPASFKSGLTVMLTNKNYEIWVY